MPNITIEIDPNLEEGAAENFTTAEFFPSVPSQANGLRSLTRRDTSGLWIWTGGPVRRTACSLLGNRCTWSPLQALSERGAPQPPSSRSAFPKAAGLCMARRCRRTSVGGDSRRLRGVRSLQGRPGPGLTRQIRARPPQRVGRARRSLAGHVVALGGWHCPASRRWSRAAGELAHAHDAQARSSCCSASGSSTVGSGRGAVGRPVLLGWHLGACGPSAGATGQPAAHHASSSSVAMPSRMAKVSAAGSVSGRGAGGGGLAATSSARPPTALPGDASKLERYMPGAPRYAVIPSLAPLPLAAAQPPTWTCPSRWRSLRSTACAGRRVGWLSSRPGRRSAGACGSCPWSTALAKRPRRLPIGVAGQLRVQPAEALSAGVVALALVHRQPERCDLRRQRGDVLDLARHVAARGEVPQDVDSRGVEVPGVDQHRHPRRPSPSTWRRRWRSLQRPTRRRTCRAVHVSATHSPRSTIAGGGAGWHEVRSSSSLLTDGT